MNLHTEEILKGWGFSVVKIEAPLSNIGLVKRGSRCDVSPYAGGQLDQQYETIIYHIKDGDASH